MSDARVPPQLVFGDRSAFAYVGDVAVAVLDVPRWTPARAVAYVEEVTELSGRMPSAAALTDFRGAMFGPRERRAIANWLAARGLGAQSRTCLMADSLFVRGAATAYAWMNGSEGRAFARREASAACAWTAEGRHASPQEVERAYHACSRLLGFVL